VHRQKPSSPGCDKTDRQLNAYLADCLAAFRSGAIQSMALGSGDGEAVLEAVAVPFATPDVNQ
jgi:hypothetical protein